MKTLIHLISSFACLVLLAHSGTLQAQPLTATDSVVHTLFEDSVGSITITSVSGSGAIHYQWSTGNTTNAITDLPVGDYTVTITRSSNTLVNQYHIYNYTEWWVLENVVENAEHQLINTGTWDYESFYLNHAFSSNEFQADSNVLLVFNFDTGVNFTGVVGLVSDTLMDENTLAFTLFVMSDSAVPDFPTSGLIAPGNEGEEFEYLGDFDYDKPLSIKIFKKGDTVIITKNDIVVQVNTLPDHISFYPLIIPFLENSYVKEALFDYQRHPLQASAQIQKVRCPNMDGKITVTPSGIAPYYYTWSTAATTSSISGLDIGDYSVTVSDATGTTISASYIVNLDSLNPIAIVPTADTVCVGSQVSLTATHYPDATMEWFANGVGGSGILVETNDTAILTIDSSTTYYVRNTGYCDWLDSTVVSPAVSKRIHKYPVSVTSALVGSPSYNANTLTYKVNFTMPSNSPVDEVLLYSEIENLPVNSGVSLTSIKDGANNTLTPVTVGNYKRYVFGTLEKGDTNSYFIKFTTNDCDILNPDSALGTVKLWYNWRCCDSIPQAFPLISSLFPTQYRGISVEPRGLNVQPIIWNQMSYAYTCSGNQFDAHLDSWNGGIGNITATFMIPDELELQVVNPEVSGSNIFKMAFSGGYCFPSYTTTPAMRYGVPYTRYTVDITTQTAFASQGSTCSGSLFGVNGLNGFAGPYHELYFRIILEPKCGVDTIHPIWLAWEGTKYCAKDNPGCSGCTYRSDSVYLTPVISSIPQKLSGSQIYERCEDPVTIIASEDTVCSGEQVTLIATSHPGDTTIWTKGNGVVVAIGDTVTVTVDTSTTFYVRNKFYCDWTETLEYSRTLSKRIIAKPLQHLYALNYTDSLPSGDTSNIVLTASLPNAVISWSRNNTTAITGQATGSGDEIKIALVNHTNYNQTTHFVVETEHECGNAEIATDVVVRQRNGAMGSADIQVDGVCPPQLVPCTSSTFTLNVSNRSQADQQFNLTVDFGAGNADIAASVTSARPFTYVAGSTSITFTNVLVVMGGNISLTYNLVIPCRMIPSTNSGTIFYLSTTVTSSITGVTFGTNVPDCQITYPFLFNPPTSFLQPLSYLQTHDFLATYRNTGAATFTGEIHFDGTFSNCASLDVTQISYRILDALGNVLSGPITTSVPAFTATVTIPVDGRIEITETVSAVGCIPTTGCSANLVFEWGCPNDRCKNQNNLPVINPPIPVTISRSPTEASLSITRLLPLPNPEHIGAQNDEEFAWDGTCMNSSQDWEFLIFNDAPSGGPAISEVNIHLFNSFLGAYTYIEQNSIDILDPNPLFPNLSLPAGNIAEHIDAYTFPTPAPACSTQLSNVISSYQAGTIPLLMSHLTLMPQEGLILRFSTYRCCPDNVTDYEIADDGYRFNRWNLQASGIDDCGGTVDMAGVNGIDYTDVNQNPATTYLPFNPEVSYGPISSNQYDEGPDLYLEQSVPNYRTELVGGQDGTCGGAEDYHILNTSFPVDNPLASDYDTQLFCENGQGGGPFGTTGSNPGGIFRIEFICPPNIQLPQSPQIFPTITALNRIWEPRPNGGWIFAQGSCTAEFDIEQNWFDLNHNPVQPPQTSEEFRLFFQHPSRINFQLQACCGDFIPGPKTVTVNTLFEPRPGNCSTACFIPLSQEKFDINVTCPGCITPGMVVRDFEIRRNTFGFSDENDDRLPETSATPPYGLLPIIDPGNYGRPLNLEHSIVGDQIEAVTEAYFQEGNDDLGGFHYQCWLDVPNQPLNHLYLEFRLDNSTSSALDVSYSTQVTLVYTPINGGTPQTYNLTVNPTVSPVTGSITDQVYLYHFELNQLNPQVQISEGDIFSITTRYQICNNPAEITNLRGQPLAYLTSNAVTADQPYFDPTSGYIGLPDDYTAGDGCASVTSNDILWECEGPLPGDHHVLPVKNEMYCSAENPLSCEKTLNSEVRYYIEGDNENAFFNEYRLVPRISALAVNQGPQLTTNTPVVMHLDVPKDYVAWVERMYTRAPDAATIHQSPINSFIAGTSVTPSSSAINPVIGGPNGNPTDFFADLSDTYYTPPYTFANFVTTPLAPMLIMPASPPQWQQFPSGTPALVLGDESFIQGIDYMLRPSCNLTTDNPTVVERSDVYAVIPDYNDGCATPGSDIQKLADDVTFSANFTSPQIIINGSVITPPTYSGNTVTYEVQFEIPQGTVSNALVYVDISSPPLNGPVEFSSFEDANNNQIPIQPIGTDFNRAVLGTLQAGTTYSYFITFTLKNCDVLSGNLPTIDLFYNWDCQAEFNGELPPIQSLCSQEQHLEIEIEQRFINVITFSDNSLTNTATCVDNQFIVSLRSSAGGVGNITATFMIPNELEVVAVNGTQFRFGYVLQGSNSCNAPFTTQSTIFNGNDYTEYTVDLTSFTGFNGSPYNCTGLGPNGLGGFGLLNEVYLFVYLRARCNTTTIHPAWVSWQGDNFCSISNSPCANCTFETNPDLYLIPQDIAPTDGCIIPNLNAHCDASLTFSPETNSLPTAVPPDQPFTTFTWSPVTPLLNTPGIAPGEYIVEITDHNNCSNIASVNVYAPLQVAPTVSNVQCNGNSDGTITLSVTGGLIPYTFIWNDGETDQDRSNLSAGNYQVTVSAANNCSTSITVTVTEPQLLSVTLLPENVHCNGNDDGSIALTASGGTPQYSFTWNDGVFVEDRINLPPASYSVTVTDENECSATATADITEPDVLQITSVEILDRCSDGINTTGGSITLSVSGGTTPHSYNWSNTTQTTNPITNLGSGSYNVTVTDANGCSTTNAASYVVDYYSLSVSVAVNNPNPAPFGTFGQPPQSYNPNNYEFMYTIEVCNTLNQNVQDVIVSFNPPSATDITILTPTGYSWNSGTNTYTANTGITINANDCYTLTVTARSNVFFLDCEHHALQFCATANVQNSTCSTSVCGATIYQPIDGVNISSIIAASTTISAQQVYVTADITIDNTAEVNISNSVFWFAPGVRLIVTPSASLIATESAFLGCDQMWRGIQGLSNASTGATLSFTSCGFSDAHYAIELLPTRTFPFFTRAIQFTSIGNQFIGNFVDIYVPQNPATILNNRPRWIDVLRFEDNTFTGNWLKPIYTGEQLVNGSINGVPTQPSVNIGSGNFSWSGLEVNDLTTFNISNVGQSNEFNSLTYGAVFRRTNNVNFQNCKFENIPAEASFVNGETPYHGYLNNSGFFTPDISFLRQANSTRGIALYFLGNQGQARRYNLRQRGFGGTATSDPSFIHCRNAIWIIAANSDIRENNMDLSNDGYMTGTIHQSSMGILQQLSPNCIIVHRDNYIVAGNSAIVHTFNDPERSTDISLNEIIMHRPTNLPNWVPLHGYGIHYVGSELSNTATNTITDNQITLNGGVDAAGIVPFNSANLEISENHIHLNLTNYDYQTRSGIALFNYRNAAITSNHIHGINYPSSNNTAGENARGIFISGASHANTDSRIDCNLIGTAGSSGTTDDHVNYGVYFNMSENSNTQLLTTRFAEGQIGLYMNETAVVLDRQPDHGNEWNGTGYTLWAAARSFSSDITPNQTDINFILANQDFRVTQNSNFYPMSNGSPSVGVSAVSQGYNLVQQGTNSTGDWFFPSANTPQVCSTYISWQPLLSSPNNLNAFDYKIIDESFWENINPDQIKNAADRYLYRKLRDNPVLRTETAVQDYYDDLLESNIHGFARIDSNIKQLALIPTSNAQLIEIKDELDSLNGTVNDLDSLVAGTYDSIELINLLEDKYDLLTLIDTLSFQFDSLQAILNNEVIESAAELREINDDISISKIYEWNEKRINDVILHTIALGNIDYDSTEIIDLYYIAGQCPLEGGVSVYKARGMLATISDTIWDDQNICGSGYSGKREMDNVKSEKSIESENRPSVVIYPNPARDEVMVKFSAIDDPNVRLQIMNSLGEVIMADLIPTNNNITVDASKIPSGLYHFTLFGFDKIVHKESIVILK